jgi:hypothetical protein
MAADHVLGVSTASTSLAQLTMRTPVQRALDLGTGSGVQLLHLSSHVADVVGTDVNPRCLDLAKLTLDLNEVAADVRAGDLFEPVAGERFDLIVSNPPFVISPGDSERLAYRDSGLPGDEVVRRLVSAGADHLSDGGWLQALGNWVHLVGEPWSERVGRWVSATGCDAWVIEREVVDPPRYVEMWLADAGLQGAPDYVRRYDAWLRWFDEQHVEAVGFGWLNLHRTGRTEPVVRLEEWPYAVDQPIGSHIAAWGRDVEAATAYGSSAHDVTDTLLRQRLVRRSDVREERTGVPGDAEPQRIVLRQRRGLRRARSVSTVEAAFYGACDGDLTVGQIAEAVAMLLGTDVTETTREVVAAARDLIATGYFTHENDPAD